MGTIISYLEEYGGYNFIEKPLCEIDGLILAHLSYYVYDGIVPGIEEAKPAVSTEYIRENMDENNFLSVTWEETLNRELFYKILETRRFRSMKANFYVNAIDKEQELQFSAITFLLGNGDIYMAFRGTDDALVGWREDFCMAYRTPVEAQKKSAEYVELVARQFSKRRKARFYLGGHSKGGNLAAYAAMCCDRKLKHKIGRVFDFDGPGFRPDFMETLDYASVREKIVKFVPEESFVGMLMQDEDENSIEYILIKSTRVGISQHMPLSWCIEDDRFVRAESNVPARKELYTRMNQWIYELGRERVGALLENLFQIVEVTEAENLSEFKSPSPELLKKTKLVRNAYRELDEETKNILWEMTIMVAELLAKDQQERIQKWKVIERMRGRMDDFLLNGIKGDR